MFQVRCVWTDPATAGEGLDPPGHCQALPLSSWVSAQQYWLVTEEEWTVGQWLAVSRFDFQSRLCGVFTQRVCGVLWGRWLRKFNFNQRRISVEIINGINLFIIVHTVYSLCFLLWIWKCLICVCYFNHMKFRHFNLCRMKWAVVTKGSNST